MYTYNFTLIRVVDGDTVIGYVDLGFDVQIKQTFRFADINTPELNSSDPLLKEQANKARDFTLKFFEDAKINNKKVTVISSKPIIKDKYGRYLGTFVCENLILNQQLIDNGLALKYS